MVTLRTGTNPVKVNADARTLLRLRRMGREMRLTDQILSFDVDSLTIVESGPAPAWTSPDGSSLTINVGMMPALTTRNNIAIWLGTNAHELFHNLFSPRKGSPLMRRVEAADKSSMPGIHRVWNVLEDQRIERLGLDRYVAWRGYLIAALSHHIAVNNSEAHLLLAGRTWLPAEARAIARAAFVATNGDASADYAARLIGDFQRLTDPGDDESEEAWAILVAFWNEYGDRIPPRKGGCGTQPVEDGEPDTNPEPVESWPAADESDEDDEDEDGVSPTNEDDDEDGEPGDDESDEDGEPGDGDGDGDGDGEGDESDEDGESPGDGDGDEDDDDFGSDGDGEAEGESHGDGGDEDGDGDDEGEGDSDGYSDQGGEGDPGDGCSAEGGARTMADAMRDAIDEALSDEDTAEDLDRVVDQVEHGTPGTGDLPRTIGVYQDVPPEARRLAREVTDVLAEIRDDNEAAWIRRTDTGRFSVERWATEDWDADTVFDEFKPGAMDASSLDAVLLLDVSGSMSSQIVRLAEATWAIRKAVDEIEGTVTCIGFGDGASMMFDEHQRPDGRIFIPEMEGSTFPTPAIREAYSVMAGSEAANKIVVMLTDGDFYDRTTVADAVSACKGEGATTVIVGLGKSTERYVRPGVHGFDFAAVITDSFELVPLFRTVAEASMRASARR